MFFLMAHDDPAKPGHRQAVRPRHLPLLTEACRSGLIRFAGPILPEGGGNPIGSLIVLDLPDRAAVEAWLGGHSPHDDMTLVVAQHLSEELP